MTPLIVQSGLTGQWYVLTRYRTVERDGKARIIASVKYDVTDQMREILKQRPKRGRDRGVVVREKAEK